MGRIMGRVSSAAVAAALAPDRLSPLPLYRQLYEKLRHQILTRAFGPGQQIPSTRVLAADLAISRNTVMNAIEQLIAEGYLEGEAKTGTFVADVIPEEMTSVDPTLPERPVRAPRDPRWSQFGARLANQEMRPGSREILPHPFRPGLSAFEDFPFDIWSRLANRHWRSPSRSVLTYGDPAGYLPLRRAILNYMTVARGVRGSPEQVIIVAGAQQGIDLTARLLLDPGDSVWMEEPGYFGAAGAFRAAGASMVPVPVDESGLIVRVGVVRAPHAKLVCVTPSHQFPRGVTMALTRRLELLNWAGKADAWILEDDYDSEYRYAGRPIPALQGLDRSDRVIYLGTFTKVLFPSIRLAFLIVPPDLVDRFVAAKAIADRQAPIPDQAILADFMSEGHFGRHIRRMRTLYLERAETLVKSIEAHLKGVIEVDFPQAGMHTIGWLREGTSDREVSHRAADAGIFVWALSSSYWQSAIAERPGVVFGFAPYRVEAIVEGVRTLARVLKST